MNEDLIRQTADAMATNGMKDAGYQYINIDDMLAGQNATRRDSSSPIRKNFRRA